MPPSHEKTGEVPINASLGYPSQQPAQYGPQQPGVYVYQQQVVRCDANLTNIIFLAGSYVFLSFSGVPIEHNVNFKRERERRRHQRRSND